MTRVLHIINGMGTGGAEKDIMNWYRNIDRNKVQFDFLVRSKEDFYFKEIEELGGHFYRVASFPKHIIKNYYQTKKMLQRAKYDVIHVHGNSLVYILPLIIAKKQKIPIRIFHAHNTQANGKIAKFLHRINKKIVGLYANTFVACSDAAGKFAFNNKQFFVINNAIDIKRYKTHSNRIRSELGIEKDTFVVGHVGRFIYTKNQKFIVDVLEELIKKKNDVKLIFVGSGEEIDDVKNYATQKDLDGNVVFMGDRNDVEDILDSFDIIIFPSLFEGMPLVVLEAQANGTRILYSSSIDSNVVITPYAREKSLEESPESWAESAISFVSENIVCDIEHNFEMAGFTIDSVIHNLYKLYGLRDD